MKNIDLVGIAARSKGSGMTRCEAFVCGLVGALYAQDRSRARDFVMALDDESVTDAFADLTDWEGRVYANKQ